MEKNFTRSRICRLAILVLMLGQYNFYTISVHPEENLIKNGSFEEIENNDGKPAFWEPVSWAKEKEISRFKIEKGNAVDGEHYVTIINKKPNHSRYIQKITVEPDCLYKISCYIKTNNVVRIDKSKGANINIETRIETSLQLFETSNAWQQVELYVHTGKNIKEINIALALGGYYGDASGQAAFDQVKMIKLSGQEQNNLSAGVPLCKIGEVAVNNQQTLPQSGQQKQQPQLQAQNQTQKKEDAKPILPTDSRGIMYLIFVFIVLFLISRVIFYNRKKLSAVLKAVMRKIHRHWKKPRVIQLPDHTLNSQR